MKDLLNKLEDINNTRNALLKEIEAYDDGYVYILTVCQYGSEHTVEHTNDYMADALMNQFNGENGIVEVKTNNLRFAEEHKNDWCLNGDAIIILDIPNKYALAG